MANDPLEAAERDPKKKDAAGRAVEARPAGAQEKPAIKNPNATSIDHAEIEDARQRFTPLTNARKRNGPILAFSFLLIVILPALLATYYYVSVASSQYISEARFAVRSLSNFGGSDEGTSSIGGGIRTQSFLQQDAYVVKSFIHSSEIVRRLNERVDPKSFFNSPSYDAYSRLGQDVTSEEFLDYWKGQVTTYVDGPSGIITLFVRAFDPQVAQTLAALITEESEKLVNELSDRSRVDVVGRVQKEVEKAEAAYRKTLADINDYQNTSGIFDPTAQATETVKLLTGLLAQKISVDSRLFVLGKNVRESAPSYQQLLRTQASLQEQIDNLRAEIAADQSANENLSSALRRFSELETERLVASGLYESARRNLASAQAEAIRKAVYVTIFVPAALPEKSLYPHRVTTPIMIFLGLFVLWSILMLFWASVEDHRL